MQLCCKTMKHAYVRHIRITSSYFYEKQFLKVRITLDTIFPNGWAEEDDCGLWEFLTLPTWISSGVKKRIVYTEKFKIVWKCCRKLNSHKDCKTGDAATNMVWNWVTFYCLQRTKKWRTHCSLLRYEKILCLFLYFDNFTVDSYWTVFEWQSSKSLHFVVVINVWTKRLKTLFVCVTCLIKYSNRYWVESEMTVSPLHSSSVVKC